MTRIRLPTVGLVLTGLLTGQPASAGVAVAVPISVNAQLPAKKPKPKPPPVIATGTKEGAKASASKNVSGRLDTGGKPPHSARKHPAPQNEGEHNPLVPVKQVAPHRDFRLNIGICGHPGGNTPALNRCLPAIEKDRPEQPDLPTATPSMVVAVRIPRPEDVEWEQVLAESKDVLFPKLRVKVQPVGRTLVNLDTIVYTDQSKVSTQTVTVLGFPVVVEAMPMSYTWDFGDGSSETTTTPGRPYPAKDITHKYMKRGGVSLSLTTHYAARFNVAGTGWQYVDGTVPITGPATALQVREAVPVLVEPER